jgi:peptidyl-prolyl cis-trans isomerase B (cyclophilin B)
MLKKLLLACAFVLLAAGVYAQTQETSPVNTATPEKLILETTKGKVVIALRPDLAPNHVARYKELAAKGFYDGVIFHRVIDGFMAQTGDPTGTGTGGSELPDLKAEFNDAPYVRGTVGAARTNSPHTANSQFFITFDDASFLNGQYTVWGQVIEGMDVVDAIEKGEPPANPDKIIKASIESSK